MKVITTQVKPADPADAKWDVEVSDGKFCLLPIKLMYKQHKKEEDWFDSYTEQELPITIPTWKIQQIESFNPC